MAWIEQTGTHTWRVRYRRPTGTCATIGHFTDAKAARDYAHDLETDRAAPGSTRPPARQPWPRGWTGGSRPWT